MFGIGSQVNRHNRRNGRDIRASNDTVESVKLASGKNTPVPIIELNEGTSGVIVELLGGCGACSRLMGLGLHQGSSVRIVRKGNNGPILIEVGDTRVGLGRAICSHIIIDTSLLDSDLTNKENKVSSKYAEILTSCECLNSGGA
jgi:ferrous iron transport protein A